MSEEETQAPAPVYQDTDLVYVDPDTKSVVGLVEWLPSGKPKSRTRTLPAAEPKAPTDPATAPAKEARRVRKPPRERTYPWGTYRSMKRTYKLEGKQPRQESTSTLDEVIEKALQEPFWD